MVFCNVQKRIRNKDGLKVTILILIDGFLQCGNEATINEFINSHNPYFNRWFSAMQSLWLEGLKTVSHNPYFNRWFSAIKNTVVNSAASILSQSLF